MREKLDALAADNVASVEHPAPNSVMLKFNLYAEAGGKIHDHLLEVLTQTLGPEREAALMTLLGDKFDWEVGSGFGAAERSVTIERRSQGSAGHPIIFYMVIERIREAGDPRLGPVTSSITQVQSRAQLDQDYTAFAKLLPTDF